ncbi:hypothetical protein HanIR_Chr02g0090701 [Helianthus annuus]|nr:hypothetical protein HanIR_Chr02g0090701 [Helianthus annuus]
MSKTIGRNRYGCVGHWLNNAMKRRLIRLKLECYARDLTRFEQDANHQTNQSRH